MVIAGDVKPAEVKKLVDKYFAWIPKGTTPARPQYKEPAPITKEIVLKTTDDVQVPKVFISWRGPKHFSADEPALALAGSILGDGKSSRLYKRLVYDEKIAQSVEAGFQGEELAGTFSIEVTAKPVPSNPPESVRMWLTTPMTSPSRLNMGPPELPGLIAASV